MTTYLTSMCLSSSHILLYMKVFVIRPNQISILLSYTDAQEGTAALARVQLDSRDDRGGGQLVFLGVHHHTNSRGVPGVTTSGQQVTTRVIFPYKRFCVTVVYLFQTCSK